MFGKLLKLAGVILVASTLLVGAGQVFAAEAPGTGPELAFTVPVGSVSIPAGGELWFAFNYAGDGSQILVDMGGNATTTTFTVWTPANVVTRSMNQSVTNVGAGSVMGYTSNPDQVWNGSFNTRGTYYVVVDQNSSGPGSFRLSVTGSGVSSAGQPMPSSSASAASAEAAGAPAASAPVTSTVAAAPAAVAPAVSAPVTTTVAAGTGPANAITGPKGWVTTTPGATTWYAFQYPGDGSQVTIHMAVYPSSAASYAVWTPQDLLSSQAGWTISGSTSPVGLGSPNPNNGNDIVWSGSFITPGTYYVVVSQGSTPGGYNLQITGSGVSFGH